MKRKDRTPKPREQVSTKQGPEKEFKTSPGYMPSSNEVADRNRTLAADRLRHFETLR